MKRKQAVAVKTGGVSADFSRTCADCACLLGESGAKGEAYYRCNAPGPRRGRTVSDRHGRFQPYVRESDPEKENGLETDQLRYRGIVQSESAIADSDCR